MQFSLHVQVNFWGEPGHSHEEQLQELDEATLVRDIELEQIPPIGSRIWINSQEPATEAEQREIDEIFKLDIGMLTGIFNVDEVHIWPEENRAEIHSVTSVNTAEELQKSVRMAVLCFGFTDVDGLLGED
ncbi:MAG: hypothetical protein HZC36_08635 [Armatimonadetes bacterium]|nr:hypothetical protein [Armatimonadota bacterium]